MRGAWIEISVAADDCELVGRSLPVRGAWIEIAACAIACAGSRGRSPCGERGLKYHLFERLHGIAGRSPCGERGLKLFDVYAVLTQYLVAPRAGSVD